MFDDIAINVTISGDELSGNIDDIQPLAEGCRLAVMSGIDENWIGQWTCKGSPVHNFTAVVRRVLPGIASR